MQSPRNDPPSRLWVCWREANLAPDPGDCILTFLLPSIEQKLKLRHPGEVLFGREASLAVRKEARRAYLLIAARLAAVPVAEGKTLRQLLASPGQSSRWWYHRVSFKDCEVDPTFDRVIALFTIIKVAEERGIGDLVLVGGPPEFRAVLEQSLRVRALSESSNGFVYLCVRSLASRLAFGLKTAYECWLARRHPAPEKFEVAFSGFWDWSVGTRYFGELPQAIQSGTDLSAGWLAWLDKHAVLPHQQPRPIFLLQSELQPWDLLTSLLNFKPLIALMRIWRRDEFRRGFEVNRLNFFPFFKSALVAGVLDSSIPYGDLVAAATERACRRLRPSVTFSFLEHFPYARAHYEGVKRAGLGTVNYTIQHASYCSEKTFLFLDPELEFRGKEDGCAVPHPHSVLAMGPFPRDLFLECGYDEGRVIVTGSPRYDRISAGDLPEKPVATGNKEVSLLLVGGLAVDPDLEMIDAACEVAKSIPELSIWFRKHPLSPIKQDRVRITHAGLDEDLSSADIILFTYSTVAEEAFLRGRPVWQWLPQGFNASALSEIVPIPRFGSVESLRESILDFRSNPAKYVPDEEARNLVLSRLFYSADGQAAIRIACLVREALKAAATD